MHYEIIEIDTAAKTNEEWKGIMSDRLKTASHFEIHCWSDEQSEIEMALSWGVRKLHSWNGGVVIEGDVTKEFSDFLLSLPKAQGHGNL